MSSIKKGNFELKLNKLTKLKESHFESKAKLKAFLYNFENIYRIQKNYNFMNIYINIYSKALLKSAKFIKSNHRY